MTENVAAPAAGSTPAADASASETSTSAPDGIVAERQFSPDQQAALKEVETLRAAFRKAGEVERSSILESMGQLTRFAYGMGARPLGFPSTEGLSDNRPAADGDAPSFGAALAPASESDLDTLVNGSVVRGLDRSVAEGVAAFVNELSMPKTVAQIVLDRAVRHFASDFGSPSVDMKIAFAPLNQQEHAEYAAEAAKLMGSTEAFEKLSRDVRDALGPETMAKLDKYGLSACSLAYDPRVLQTLLYHARTRRA
jgi:hypothetical protein